MEGEIKNLILVWVTVVASLCYCHLAGNVFPKGKARGLAILPVICLFFVLPLNLTSVHLGGTMSFFIAWLCSFKLMLFACCTGPLYSNPPIPLSRFIPLACFPIRFRFQEYANSKTVETVAKKRDRSFLVYVAKVMIFALLIRVYDYKKFLHPKIIWFCYCLHIYFMLEMILTLVAALVYALLRVELEPQFDEPYLSTSLQNFWGKRWNLMVPNILHPTVYKPVRSLSSRFIERKWSPIPAILATFLVSGLMHELVFFNFGRLRPTGEVTGFFLLHGVSLSVELVVKKLLQSKFTLPGVVSGPLTLAYVINTSFWLFFPPFVRAKADLKGCLESFAIIESVKSRQLVGPDEVSCPFL